MSVVDLDPRHTMRTVAGVPARVGSGVTLCAGIALLSVGLQALETRLLGRAWIESLVLAIMCGAVLRSLWTPPKSWCAGIAFSAKTLLEVAVALLGLSVSARTLAAVGPGLISGIVAIVAVVLPLGFVLARAFGLPARMALLVACGNAICGNSAIAAVAPVIGADGEDVAGSIAFTAVLGVAVVLGLPVLAPALGMSAMQCGTLAGLTVYAVPQVLAAAAPAGAAAVQVGTLVKLVRVLMLGPVLLGVALLARQLRQDRCTPHPNADASKAARLPLGKVVPWFIPVFLTLAGLRSFGLVPEPALAPAAEAANVLTLVSMAALGLGVDVRVVARAGLRVTAATTASLLVLAVLSLGLIRVLGIA